MSDNFQIREKKIFDMKIKYFDFGDVTNQNSIYIQGQLHSNEVNSFSTLKCLVEKLKNNEPPVPIRIVPMCNPIGWFEYLYGNDGRISHPNGVDWNRIFNILESKNTIENELSTTLWELSEGFSKIIDVHTPEFGFPHIYITKIEYHLNTFYDLPYVLSDEGLVTAFEDSNALLRKIHACTLEISNDQIWTNKNEEYWANRILKEIFFKKEDSLKNEKYITYGYMRNYYTKYSGIPVLVTSPNQKCKKGSDIVKVLTIDGHEDIIKCEEDCIPICFRRRGIVNAGSWVFRAIHLSKQ